MTKQGIAFRWTDDGRRVELLEALTVDVGLVGPITVPAGFETDGASIPRPLWSLVGQPLAGDTFRAAVVHDALCEAAWRSGLYEDRLVADAVFRSVLRQEGVGFWKRLAYYLAVRFWGRWCYRPNAERRKS